MKKAVKNMLRLWGRPYMEVIICTSVFCAGHFSMAENSEILLNCDSLQQENHPVSLASNNPPTVLSMVLHDAPKEGYTACWLSWSITNLSGTVTTIFPVALSESDVPGVIRYASLDPQEAKEIVGIATGLLLVESDSYLGWSGPLYGLDFRLNHPSIAGVVSWKKWSSSTNVLDNTCLKGNILRLREITSNAYKRAETAHKELTKSKGDSAQ